MTAYDEKLAAAIAKAGVPLSADLVAPKPEQRLDLDAIVARALRIARQYVMPDETDQDDLDRLTDFDVPQLVAEVRRLRIEAQKARAQIANHQPVLAQVDRLRAHVGGLEKRLHDAAMTRTWRNEDGKKFVFVEDIAPALLGLEPKAGESK
jgi:hypothetical protein